MSALVIRLRKVTTNMNVQTCQGCRKGRSARYLATIIDYDVASLCTRCAREWRAVWDGAVGPLLEKKRKTPALEQRRAA